jgi:hypothetical protein
MIPIGGIFLFILPMLWTLGDGPPPLTKTGIIYVFLIWVALIILSVLTSLWLDKTGKESKEGGMD